MKQLTVNVVEGESGTAMPALHPTAATENTNCAQRMRFGSNDWKTSALRQWLNSEADAWWSPQNVFDRPANASVAGFLHGLDPAFLKVVGEVKKTTQRSISDGYGFETSAERFFLLSRPEVYAGIERPADGPDGEVYEYYGPGHSDLSSPGAGADANRIKYRAGTATYWWLRTPLYGNCSHVRSVSQTGSLYNHIAYGEIRVAPACCIV